MTTDSAQAEALAQAPLKAQAMTLADLAQLNSQELMTLYRSADTPHLPDLDGPLIGLSLAMPQLESPTLAGLVRRFNASPLMPWRGKTFHSLDAEQGEGVNRIFNNKNHKFRFATFLGPSRVGNFEALQIDYSGQGNPPLIRQVRDEVREIAPGLWLGLTYLQFKASCPLIAFFGLALPHHVESTKTCGDCQSSPQKTLLKVAAVALPIAGLVWWLRRRKKE